MRLRRAACFCSPCRRPRAHTSAPPSIPTCTPVPTSGEACGAEALLQRGFDNNAAARCVSRR